MLGKRVTRECLGCPTVPVPAGRTEGIAMARARGASVFSLMLIGLGLTGCVTEQTFVSYLKRGPETVRCGPYPVPEVTYESGIRSALAYCVDDYLRAGFERLPPVY